MEPPREITSNEIHHTFILSLTTEKKKNSWLWLWSCIFYSIVLREKYVWSQLTNSLWNTCKQGVHMQVKLQIIMPRYSQLISKVRLYINECVISHLRSDKWTTGFQGIKINSVIFWWLMKSICPFIHVCPMIMYVVVYAFIGFTYLQLNIRATLLCLLSIMKIHCNHEAVKIASCLVLLKCSLHVINANCDICCPILYLHSQYFLPPLTCVSVCTHREREKGRSPVSALVGHWWLLADAI